MTYDDLLREVGYSLPSRQQVIGGAIARKQSQNEIATPFGLAMTTYSHPKHNLFCCRQ